MSMDDLNKLGIPVEEYSMPPMGSSKALKPKDFVFKTVKLDFNEAGDVALFESLVNKHLLGNDVRIIKRESFTFQDRYFVIVEYVEKRT